VGPARVKSPYFRLLARDPDILGACTKTDKDVFYNPTAGRPQAERELSVTTTSRYNGCIYCASVHARFAPHFSKRGADVDRCWNAIIAAVRAAGLDDLAIAGVVHGAAFFNLANRLMLSLGMSRTPAS
jgi:AhpD family alkylhydroperoxidase